jgi:FkbM family methyltransferase
MINSFLRNLGVELKRFKKSPYHHLIGYPRYQAKEIDLLGKAFKVTDFASFHSSYSEIFIDQIYKFDCKSKSPVIIDCGSNYGTSIVYFKNLYPDSHITGIEADPQTFQFLSQNIELRSFKNVKLLNRAVSTHSGKVQFCSEGADSGRIHNLENAKAVHEVETIQLDELIEGHVDFLKIDIEGEESMVLAQSKNLMMIDKIFVEYHSFSNSEQQLSFLLDSLNKAGFRYYIRSQFCSIAPFSNICEQQGMDLQLNIFALRR